MPSLNLVQRAAFRRNAILRTWVLGGALLVFALLHLLKRGAGFEGPVLPFASAWFFFALANLGLVGLALRKDLPAGLPAAEKAFDLVLIGALSSLSGGAASPLTALFFVVTFGSQIDLPPGLSRWVQGGSVLACLAAEIQSSGLEYADWKEWVLWSSVYLLATSVGERTVSPLKRNALRYALLQEFRLDANRLLSAGGDLKAFPDFLAKRLVELFGLQHGALLRYRDASNELLLKAAVNIPLEGQALLHKQTVGPDAQGVGAYAAYGRRTTFLRDPAENPKLPPILRRVFAEAGSTLVSSVPMVFGGELVGVAVLSSAGKGGRVEDEEVAFLEFACGLVGNYLVKWETQVPPAK